jgi:Fe2+ transport system protein FeoA
VSRIVPIDLLAAGESGCVYDVSGSESFVHRLAEMGLRPGAALQMVSPGEPCLLNIGGHRLSLRCEEHAMVLVEVCRDVTSPAAAG